MHPTAPAALPMTSSPRPAAFLCRRFTPAVEAAMHERYALTVNEDDAILPSAAIAERAQGCSLLFVTATETIDAATIARLAPALRCIAGATKGLRGLGTRFFSGGFMRRRAPAQGRGVRRAP